ncbi:MAG: CPBP family intramembrane glutamic endopeptidase, partial [bacterium]
MDDLHSPEEPTPDSRALYPPPSQTFLILIIAIGISLLLGFLLKDFGKINVVVSELCFIIPALIFLRQKGYNLRRCLRWNSISPPTALLSVLIGVALIVLLDELDRLVAMVFPMPEEFREILGEFLKLESWQDYLFMGVGVVLAAAVAEESLFRGFMQVSLEAYQNINRAVLLGALLFALAHFNPWWMMQILILGIFLGYLSWRANSVFPGMIVHALNNGLALFTGGDLGSAEW